VTTVVTWRDMSRPWVIGHRGEPSTAPEETLPSFQAAIDDQADVIEFDVRWTKDNEMVALHDSTLNRTTDCTGAVQSKTLAEVRRCDAGSWLAAKWTGTRVPTMREVVALAKKHHKRIAPEIKQNPVTRAQVTAFAREITDAGIASSTVVQSFSATALKLFRSVEEDAALGYLNSGAAKSVTAIEATGAVYYIVPYTHITRAQVRTLRRAHIRVWVYTITNAANNLAATNLLPNGIITNNVVLTRSGLR
jgi:glycerophosphoryl diester phosphodiesterase